MPKKAEHLGYFGLGVFSSRRSTDSTPNSGLWIDETTPYPLLKLPKTCAENHLHNQEIIRSEFIFGFISISFSRSKLVVVSNTSLLFIFIIKTLKIQKYDK